jgi:hypothetical protein
MAGTARRTIWHRLPPRWDDSVVGDYVILSLTTGARRGRQGRLHGIWWILSERRLLAWKRPVDRCLAISTSEPRHQDREVQADAEGARACRTGAGTSEEAAVGTKGAFRKVAGNWPGLHDPGRHPARRSKRAAIVQANRSAGRPGPREVDGARTTSQLRLLSNHPGLSVEEIARLVGHETTSVTQKVYRFELRPMLIEGADAMDRLLAGSGDECPSD